MQESSFVSWQLQLDCAGWQARLAQSRQSVIFVILPEGINAELTTRLVACWLARLYLGNSQASRDWDVSSALAPNYVLGGTELIAMLTQLIHEHHLQLHLEQTRQEQAYSAVTSKFTTINNTSITSNGVPAALRTGAAGATNLQLVNRAEFAYQLVGWELVALHEVDSSVKSELNCSSYSSCSSTPISTSTATVTTATATSSLVEWFEMFKWNFQQLGSPALSQDGIGFLDSDSVTSGNHLLQRAVYWLPQAKHEDSSAEFQFFTEYLELQEQALQAGMQVLPLVVFTTQQQLTEQWLPWCRLLHLDVPLDATPISTIQLSNATRSLTVQVWNDVPWWSLLEELVVAPEQLVQLLLGDCSSSYCGTQSREQSNFAYSSLGAIAPVTNRSLLVTDSSLFPFNITSVAASDTATAQSSPAASPAVASHTLSVNSQIIPNSLSLLSTSAAALAPSSLPDGRGQENSTLKLHSAAATWLDVNLLANTRDYITWLQGYRHGNAGNFVNFGTQEATSVISSGVNDDTLVIDFSLAESDSPLAEEVEQLSREQLSAWFDQVSRYHDVTLAHSVGSVEIEQLETVKASAESARVANFSTLSAISDWTPQRTQQPQPTRQLLPRANSQSSTIKVLLPRERELTHLRLDVNLGSWSNQLTSYLQERQRQAAQLGIDYVQQLTTQVSLLEEATPRVELEQAVRAMLRLGRIAPQLAQWLELISSNCGSGSYRNVLGASGLVEVEAVDAEASLNLVATPLFQEVLLKIKPLTLCAQVQRACIKHLAELHGYAQLQSYALLRNPLLLHHARMHAEVRLTCAELKSLTVQQHQLELVRALLHREQRGGAWDYVVVPHADPSWLGILAHLGVTVLPERWMVRLGSPAPQQVYLLPREVWSSAETTALSPAGGYWGYSISDIVDVLIHKILTEHGLEVLPWLLVQLQSEVQRQERANSQADAPAYRWQKVFPSQLARYRRSLPFRFIPSELEMWGERFGPNAGWAKEVSGESGRKRWQLQRDANGKYILTVALLTQVPRLRYELIVNEVLFHPERWDYAKLTAEHLLELLSREVKYYLALAQVINPSEYRITPAQLRKQFKQVWSKLIAEFIAQLRRGAEDSQLASLWNEELVHQARHELRVLAQIFTHSATEVQGASLLGDEPTQGMERTAYLAALQQVHDTIWNTYLVHALTWHTESMIELAPASTSHLYVAIRHTGLEEQLSLLGMNYHPTQLYYQLLQSTSYSIVPVFSFQEQNAGVETFEFTLDVRAWLGKVIEQSNQASQGPDNQDVVSQVAENHLQFSSVPQLITYAEFAELLVNPAQHARGEYSAEADAKDASNESSATPLLILYIAQGDGAEPLLKNLLLSPHHVTVLNLETQEDENATVTSTSKLAELPQVVTLRSEEVQALSYMALQDADRDRAYGTGRLAPQHYLTSHTGATWQPTQHLPRFITHDLHHLQHRASLTPLASDIALEDLQMWCRWYEFLRSKLRSWCSASSSLPAWNAMLHAWHVLLQQQHQLPHLRDLTFEDPNGSSHSTTSSSVVTVDVQLAELQEFITSYNHLALQSAVLQQIVLGQQPYLSDANLSMEKQVGVVEQGWLSLIVSANSANGSKGREEEIHIQEYVLLQPQALDLIQLGININAWQYAEIFGTVESELESWCKLIEQLTEQLSDMRYAQECEASLNYQQQQFQVQQHLLQRVAQHFGISEVSLGCEVASNGSADEDFASALKALTLQNQRWSCSFKLQVVQQQELLQAWLETASSKLQGQHESATVTDEVMALSTIGERWEQLAATPAYQHLEQLLAEHGIVLSNKNATEQVAWWTSVGFFSKAYSYVQRVLRVQNLPSEAQVLHQLLQQQLQRIDQLLVELQQVGVEVNLVTGVERSGVTNTSRAGVPLTLGELLDVESLAQQLSTLEARQHSKVLIEAGFDAGMDEVLGTGQSLEYCAAGNTAFGAESPQLFKLALESASAYIVLQGNATCVREVGAKEPCFMLASSAEEQGMQRTQVTLTTPQDLAWVLTDAATGIPLIAGLNCAVAALRPEQRQQYVNLLLQHHSWRRTRHQARRADYGISRLARLQQAQTLAVRQPLFILKHQIETELRDRVQYRPSSLHAPSWHARHLYDYLLPQGIESVNVRVPSITGTGTSNHVITAWQLQAQGQLQAAGRAMSLGLASSEMTGWGATRHYAISSPELIAQLPTAQQAQWKANSATLTLDMSSYLLLNYELVGMYQWQDLRLQSWNWSLWQQQQRYAWLGQELVATYLQAAAEPQELSEVEVNVHVQHLQDGGSVQRFGSSKAQQQLLRTRQQIRSHYHSYHHPVVAWSRTQFDGGVRGEETASLHSLSKNSAKCSYSQADYLRSFASEQLNHEWLGVDRVAGSKGNTTQEGRSCNSQTNLPIHKQIPQQTSNLGLDLLRKTSLLQASAKYQLLRSDLKQQLASELVEIYGLSNGDWLVTPQQRTAISSSGSIAATQTSPHETQVEAVGSQGTTNDADLAGRTNATPQETTPQAGNPAPAATAGGLRSWWSKWFKRNTDTRADELQNTSAGNPAADYEAESPATMRSATAPHESRTTRVVVGEETRSAARVADSAELAAGSAELATVVSESQVTSSRAKVVDPFCASWSDLVRARNYEQLTELLSNSTLLNRNGQLTWLSLTANNKVNLQTQQLLLPPCFYTSVSGTVGGEAWQRRRQELFTYSKLERDYLAPDYIVKTWSSDLPQQASYLIRNLPLSPYDCKQMAFSYLFAQACYTMVLGYENKHLMSAIQDAYIDPRWVMQCFWGEGEHQEMLTWDGAGDAATHGESGSTTGGVTNVSSPQQLVSRVMYVNAAATLLQMNFAGYKLRALDLHLSKQQAQLEVNELLVLSRLHYLYWNSLVSTLRNLQACMDGKLGWQYLTDLQNCYLERLYKSTYNFYSLDDFTKKQLEQLSEHYTSTVTTYTYKAMQLYLYQSL